MMMSNKSKNTIYKIIYKDNSSEKCKTMHISLPSIRALSKYLNRFMNNNKDRKVVIVWVSNGKFEFVRLVQFLNQEIEAQKFIEGKKQRVLAWAKYKCGYDLAIDI